MCVGREEGDSKIFIWLVVGNVLGFIRNINVYI